MSLLPNPSGQDQWGDHFYPALAKTLFLLTIPIIGAYLSCIPSVMALYKELIEDQHWKDLFKDTPEGMDGRTDLFYRLLGCVTAYSTLIWR